MKSVAIYGYYEENFKNIFSTENILGDTGFFKEILSFCNEKKIKILSLLDFSISENIDLLIYFDQPTKKIGKIINLYDIKNIHVVALEHPLLKKYNWNYPGFEKVNKIFSWNKNISKKLYVEEFLWPVKHPGLVEPSYDALPEVCLIASNKDHSHKLSLYKKRLKTLREVGKFSAIKKANLFGYGWESKAIKSRFFQKLFLILNFKIKNKNIPKEYISSVKNKSTCIKKYRFHIVFENFESEYPYITEKIFDVLRFGGVPIYAGCKNISCFIPENIYIKYENLNNNLINYYLNEKNYTAFIENVNNFFSSVHFKSFDASLKAEKILMTRN